MCNFLGYFLRHELDERAGKTKMIKMIKIILQICKNQINTYITS